MKTLYEIMTDLKIAQLPVWTVSTTTKIPIDPKSALKANFNEDTINEWFAYASNPKQTLVTLDDLYNCPNTPNRAALYADVFKEKIMIIDIEKIYDTKYNYLIKKLPIVYGEYSKNGGSHLIVPISDDILNDLKYHPMFLKTKIEFAKTNDPHSGIEIFFQNHYITFTQKQFNVKNSNTDKELREVLDELLTIVNTTIVNNKLYIDIDDDAPTDALTIAEHVLTPKQRNIIKKYIRTNKTEDISHREYKNIFVITKQIMHTIENKFPLNPLKKDNLIDPNALEDPEILTWVILTIVYEYLEPRDKWNKNTNGSQNYIQYSCNKALNYHFKEKNKKN